MEVFAIAPAGSRGVLFLVVILVVVLGAVTASVLSGRAARFEVSGEGLRLRGDMFGRLIPADQLRAMDARRVDFTTEPGLTPRRRTLGTGLPGYQAGWFRLRNGEKALVYLTDRSRAVYVPTTAGYGVLLSPAEPDAFLAALR